MRIVRSPPNALREEDSGWGKPTAPRGRSVAKQLPERRARRILAVVFPLGSGELAAGEVEVFAEGTHVFFGLGFRPSVAALMGDPGIVTDTIAADAQV